MKNRSVYDDIEMRYKLLEKLKSIPDVNIPKDGVERRPTIPFSVLEKNSSLEHFLNIWKEYIENIMRFT